MIKIFLTGDNHFGRTYSRYPEAREQLMEARLQSFKNAVASANRNQDDFFVVSGDLFDSINTGKSIVHEVTSALSVFDHTVLVLPGNHDYFTGEENVWKSFNEELAENGYDNILLLNKSEPVKLESAHGETVYFFPAYCPSKHSSENMLGWIRSFDFGSLDENSYRVGVAHGALQSITPDSNQQYFLMTLPELEAIPADVWLIGHTHIPYPDNLEEDRFKTSGKIFNAGTHEQMDLANNTDGECFEILMDRSNDSPVKARKYVSGIVHFRELALNINAGEEDADALKDHLDHLLKDIRDQTIVRVRITGSVTEEEYKERKSIYDQRMSRFLAYEVIDDDLSETITEEMIRDKFAETSFAARFLTELLDDPKEAQMALELLEKCKE